MGVQPASHIWTPANLGSVHDKVTKEARELSHLAARNWSKDCLRTKVIQLVKKCCVFTVLTGSRHKTLHRLNLI